MSFPDANCIVLGAPSHSQGDHVGGVALVVGSARRALKTGGRASGYYYKQIFGGGTSPNMHTTLLNLCTTTGALLF